MDLRVTGLPKGAIPVTLLAFLPSPWALRGPRLPLAPGFRKFHVPDPCFYFIQFHTFNLQNRLYHYYYIKKNLYAKHTKK